LVDEPVGCVALNNLVAVTRPNFFPLAIVIVVAALAAAFYAHRTFNGIDAILVLIGAILLHASVNAYNNYFDYRSKIDHRTLKTPFSGGVDLIVKGSVKPSAAFAVASVCLLGAAIIGAYFLERFLALLLPMMIFGAFAIVLYSPILSKIPAVSEILAGTGFGLMGLGAYVTQAGVMDATGFSILVPVTILVALLLFLNEFPDSEIDEGAGRRHLVILLGKSRSAWVYVAGLVATYVSILISIAVKAAPPAVLVALVTAPIAYKAGRTTVQNYDRTNELIPALGTNVIVILATILLLAVGFAMGTFL
jgi:1,4-dihydroxy-2-naphthoate octaprenyltransferase